MPAVWSVLSADSTEGSAVHDIGGAKHFGIAVLYLLNVRQPGDGRHAVDAEIAVDQRVHDRFDIVMAAGNAVGLLARQRFEKLTRRADLVAAADEAPKDNDGLTHAVELNQVITEHGFRHRGRHPPLPSVH